LTIEQALKEIVIRTDLEAKNIIKDMHN